ncbi:tRNA epoxyqueuosine(34) reductase QueG [Alicyclobacillus dauci]|uniref:tRNA epoxyqueuosine(34) reductase QueG n=1 Tax=Alicyclobacillus dauci TaxID=1475485 RepID=A0ABY6Z117_9BACL|nr:tRNA epoxyqueuosine(34) reductase QueG [Alicyclobacillus dauci]WAH36574.1 tRNA epoxyqueuosine(34) reductase QueG [Alicyclobacillus dauci]
MTSSTVTLERLEQLAEKIGLQEIGVTDASPFPELIPWLEAYEQRGRTGFEASDIEQRINPKLWMPGANSIIVATLPYLTEEGISTARSHPRGRQHGQASCYTYGVDYHTVLSRLLHELHKAMEAEVGHSIDAKLSVDTSPLVDRRMAERAGLGWIGKNSMFYSDRYGSFVFLGAMLVDIAIDVPRAVKPLIGYKCGTCNLCLTACPTGAIIAPGVIDATRCLSYITQMKGVIPSEFRTKLGRRVWGCDVCQWACPENRNVDRSRLSVFGPTSELAYPDLLEILHLSNRQFTRLYGHTSMAWRGLRTLQRNALIALGNAGNQGAVPDIATFLQHNRVELRISAAWALGQIGGQAAYEALKTALDKEEDEAVIEELRNGVSACYGRR